MFQVSWDFCASVCPYPSFMLVVVSLQLGLPVCLPIFVSVSHCLRIKAKYVVIIQTNYTPPVQEPTSTTIHAKHQPLTCRCPWGERTSAQVTSQITCLGGCAGKHERCKSLALKEAASFEKERGMSLSILASAPAAGILLGCQTKLFFMGLTQNKPCNSPPPMLKAIVVGSGDR